MRRKLTALTVALALASMVTLAPMAGTTSAAPAPAAAGGLVIPITTALTNTATGTFAGTFTVTRFVARNGQLSAVGTLAGTIKDAAGNIVGSVAQTITVPVANISGSCDILHLELGPIDLNLLGLVVHVDKIVIDIDAQSGPGNLLGNLLCAVAGLLNNNGPLSHLVNLLNQILGQL